MSALQEGGIKQKRAREQVEEKRKPTINRKSVIKTRLFIGNVAFMRRAWVAICRLLLFIVVIGTIVVMFMLHKYVAQLTQTYILCR